MPSDASTLPPLLVRLPLARAGLLARWRASPEVQALIDDDALWLYAKQASTELVTACLSIPDATRFVPRGEAWFPLGSGFAIATPALDAFQPLARILQPAALPLGDGSVGLEADVYASELAARRQDAAKERLRLTRSSTPRASTALLVSLEKVAEWLAATPEKHWAHYAAAQVDGYALLLAAHPPAIAGAQRFWGDRVLLPMGFELAPRLPSASLLSALGVEAGERLLVQRHGISILGRDAFGPLTRAGTRLAWMTHRQTLSEGSAAGAE